VRYVGLWTVQDGFDPLETLESVETRSHHYEQCHKVIRTPESISELKSWRDQQLSSNNVWLDIADTETLEAIALPKHGTRFTTPVIGQAIENLDIDRAYRRAVVAQQTTAERAVKWQADTLPVGNFKPPGTIHLTLEGRSGAPSATRRGPQGVLKRVLYVLLVWVCRK
jgi:hypothetical protein